MKYFVESHNIALVLSVDDRSDRDNMSVNDVVVSVMEYLQPLTTSIRQLMMHQ